MGKGRIAPVGVAKGTLFFSFFWEDRLGYDGSSWVFAYGLNYLLACRIMERGSFGLAA